MTVASVFSINLRLARVLWKLPRTCLKVPSRLALGGRFDKNRSAMKQFLSKSKLMSARQCLKRLHLEIHHPELRLISPATEAAFETGHRIGAVAHQVYGTEDAVFIPYEGGLSHALKKTARLVKSGPLFPIFEATFQHDGVLVRVDALMPDEDGWRIVEVKASTSVKLEHSFDCAVQAWVFQGMGHRMKGVALAHVDNSFVYRGDGNYQGLLVEQDMADDVGHLLPEVPVWVREARQAATGGEPVVPVGRHCFEPYECPFVAHCWPSDTDYPVQGLAGSREKLGEFVRQGYRDLREVPASALTEKQQWIQRVTNSGKGELLPGASRFVAELAYPRYFLDFETIMPAVPVWEGTRPYETLPFQWSCHYESAPGMLAHAEFLDLSGEPPMRRLAESLVRALGTEGPVLMYTPYEKRMITELGVRFPDLSAALLAIAKRLIDLAPVCREYYYHPDMHGSWSLKAVMPTIAAEMNYSKLVGIQEGMAASEGYLEAIDPATTSERKAELQDQLLRYCRFDTEALARLVQFLGQQRE
jgi:hypothetical protein